MKDVIYAKSLATNIIDKLNPYCRVHSIFKNGINLETKDGLIFIGSDKNGQLPFGIHLNEEDIEKLTDICKETIFRCYKKDKKLIAKDKVIDLNKAYYYTTKLPENKYLIETVALIYLFNKLLEMDFDTGLEMKLKEIILDNNELIGMLRSSIVSQNNEYIKGNLRKIIGRGKGLTPSGDDLLIGILFMNDIKRICSNEFLASLKELIAEEQLTTDVSLNYYKAAFSGDYSSNLISLSQALLSVDKDSIRKYILQIAEYGHTSGRDTLSGIALGIDIINIKEGFTFENSNRIRRKCLRKQS